MVTSVPAGPDSGAWPGAAGACAPAAAAGGARAGGPTAAAPGGRPSVWQCPPPDRKITDLGEAGGEPQGLQLPDVVAGLLGFVDAAGVVAGAQVVVAGGGVGEQVPDDHQDGAGDGDQGLALAAALDQTPVALAEEGVGLGGSRGGLTQHALEVGVALAGLAGAGLGAGLEGPWAQPGPRHQLPRSGEDTHVQPELGEEDLGGAGPDAGDLIQPRHGGQYHCVRAAASTRAGGAVGVHPLRGGDRRDQLLDAGGERADLAAEGVDLTGKSQTSVRQAAAAGEAGSCAVGCGCKGGGQAAGVRVTVNPRACSWRMWLRVSLALSMRLAW